MARVVAIDLPGGLGFVDALSRIWDAGDAALPLDRRAPAAARARLLHELRPSAVVDADGAHALDDGLETEAGDALVMSTSGSTGRPKGVVLTHDAVGASALATTARLGLGPGDTWLACLPLSHVGGLGVVTRAMVTGTGLIVHDGFDAAAAEVAARSGATAVSLVATALARIDADLFGVIVLGGSRPPSDRPPNTVTTYGLTETGSGVVYDGRPLDGVEVRLAGDGQIQLRCPMSMRCYRGRSALHHPIDADGWLATGDVGEWREDGRLHVAGRRGDLIVTGGENVWPEQVEAALRLDPAIGEVVVAGVDDPEWGQRVVAWVVPSGPAEPTLDGLRARVREVLPAFMAPKELRLIGEIPRTALGKPERHRLVAGGPPT
ncbi:MAG: menE [Ilumatobacteraceae bacterium]|nr:menE [Ilumatobacteraceae bacterium]